MPWSVFLAVLFGAALHAGWNALVKSGTDKLLDMLMVSLGSGLLAAIALPFLPLPPLASWPFLAASLALHVVYAALVVKTYQTGDLSVGYPLMRGSAPPLVALIGWLVLGEKIGTVGWIAVLLVSGGALTLVISERRRTGRFGRASVYALTNALVIAGYSIADGLGARASGHAVAYVLWLFLLDAVGVLALTMSRRRLGPILAYGRTRGRIALLGGAGSLGSYGLAIWAATQAPLALVAALRESSIVFGTLIGAFVLGEHVGLPRWTAVVIIAGGVILLRAG
ncbi:MAG: EamA family transporter [Alphaproteobacteria bacterium]|nr:EamA family transporter [Alphaproteobacteria bacterium]